MSKMIKVYEIEPSGLSYCDRVIVEAGETWQPALDAICNSLEEQYIDDEIEWGQINVTIKCGFMTREQLDHLERPDF